MGIIELNKDVEQYVLASKGLTFVHFSDIHAKPELWDRIVEYINNYSTVISFGLHTGDYCGGSQRVYADMYGGKACSRSIYNCAGNHDCYSGFGPWVLNDKSITHDLLFNHTDDWGVEFFDCKDSMSYYKDFDELRLIVLDDYYDTWQTRPWLRALLKDAYEKGLHVITAQHEPTSYINNTFNAGYHTYEDCNKRFREYELNRSAYDYDHRGRVLYEDVIAEFIEYGGRYVCNLAGHDHIDQFGLTDRGILNLVVGNGTSWDGISDIQRIAGERSEDLFNVVSVNTRDNTIRVVRIGAGVDRSGRAKRMLVFDYAQKKLLDEQS